MNRIKILIIDDEWLIRLELKNMLAQYAKIGVIDEAANISEAIALYAEKKHDVIFLDIQMPGGSGFDFLEKINGKYKLVFITGFDQYLAKAKKFSAIGYLMKPINKDQLSKVIKKL